MSTTRVIAFISLFLVTILKVGIPFTYAAQSNVTSASYEKPAFMKVMADKEFLEDETRES
jgi:hypothetical protein